MRISSTRSLLPLSLGLLLTATIAVACDPSGGSSGDDDKEGEASDEKKEAASGSDTAEAAKSEEEIRAEVKAELEAENKKLAEEQAKAEAEAKAARGHCADGLLARGNEPPDGFERWCEKPDANGKPSGTRVGLYESWHANGKTHQEIFYKDGLEDGPFIVYNDKGIKETQGQMTKGKMSGTWEVWTDDGKPHSIMTYDQTGKLHGPMTTYFSNGAVHIKANYANGLLDGEYAEYHEETTNLARKGTYAKGLAQGTFEEFYDDGRPIGTETYEEGVETAHACGEGAEEVTEVIEKTGNKLVSCQVDGKKYGPGAEYYAETGNLFRTGMYVNDRKEGLWVGYWDKTPLVVRAQATWIKGKRDGMFTAVHEDGITLRMQGEYINGKQEGPWAEWYPNGNVDNAGEYLANKRSGLWTWFYENGKVKSQVHWDDGDRTGFGKRWHDNGKLKMQGYWADDKRVGTWNVYDRKGNWKEDVNCNVTKCR